MAELFPRRDRRMSLGEAFSRLIKRMIEEEFRPEKVEVVADVGPLGGTYYIEMVLPRKEEEIEYRLTEIVNEVEMSFYTPTTFQIEKNGEKYVVRALYASPEARAYAAAWG